MYVTFHACMYILYIDNFFHKKQLASLVQCSLGERLQKNRKKERKKCKVSSASHHAITKGL